MANRPIDLTVASLIAVPVTIICALAAAGIWLSAGRPVLYRARRVGRCGRIFTMYKLRTMRPASGGARVTGPADRRLFPLGAWLRRWKIDELPQLLNVVRGDMSLVGPRPEDPEIVERWYGPLARLTLEVRPGLASPGSIYNFTHGEQLLGSIDVEDHYARQLLPRKLALDLLYAREASPWYDVRILARAACVVVAAGIGRQVLREPPELRRIAALERSMGQDTAACQTAMRRRA